MAQRFLWSDEYNFGIAEIDSQHQYFVSIINELYDAILSLEVKAKLNEIFTKLAKYAVEHFATEEKYFAKFNYAGAAEHIAKHEEMKAKITELQNKIKEDNFELSFDLIDFLEEWLVDHLAVMDKKYVECFKANGLK
jgi:hemerythrin-like metal-binding protein